MWPSAIGAPQRKRMAIGKTVTISKHLTRLVGTMIIDAASAGFINCELPPKSLNDTYLLIRARHATCRCYPTPSKSASYQFVDRLVRHASWVQTWLPDIKRVACTHRPAVITTGLPRSTF